MKLIYWSSVGFCSTVLGTALFYSNLLLPSAAKPLKVLTEPFNLNFSHEFTKIIVNQNLGSKIIKSHSTPGVKVTVLHYFNGDNKSGKNPISGLIYYKNALYGATRYGANRANYAGIFKFDLATNTLTQLHNFNPKKGIFGSQYVSQLESDQKGNFYGTTRDGGVHGLGTIFKVTSNGSYTLLYSFKGLEDRRSPQCKLALDPSGNLYGSVDNQIFKLGPKNKLTILGRFSSYQGTSINAGVVSDPRGNFYASAAYDSAYENGSLVKLSHNGKLYVLNSFKVKQGISPSTGVIRDSRGNLFGTTFRGGAYGQGTIFKFSPDKKLFVLHNFNGKSKNYALIGLIQDSANNLYGSYPYENLQNEIFQLATDGTYTSLYQFTGLEGYVTSGLVISNGTLYGINYLGGPRIPRCGGVGCGTIFKLSITPSSSVRKHSKSPILQSPSEDFNEY